MYRLFDASAVVLFFWICAQINQSTGDQTGTFLHAVKITYVNPQIRNMKLQAVLARWKSVLADPKFSRSAVDIKLVKVEPVGRRITGAQGDHVVTYEVTYNKPSSGLPKVTQTNANNAFHYSLRKQPIGGVEAVVQNRYRLDSNGML